MLVVSLLSSASLLPVLFWYSPRPPSSEPDLSYLLLLKTSRVMVICLAARTFTLTHVPLLSSQSTVSSIEITVQLQNNATSFGNLLSSDVNLQLTVTIVARTLLPLAPYLAFNLVLENG